MDIRMPVMDGYDATRKIHELKRQDAAAVPIIAMTANAFAEDVKKCYGAGMSGHISKPIDPRAMYDTLSRVMNRNQENKKG
jgi:two-component system sensor histidine kinase/response regulator